VDGDAIEPGGTPPMFAPTHTRIATTLLLLIVSAPSPSRADGSDYFGLLRARDLTSFGYLRLDMRPTWAIETELAYQNTWALSPETEQYLTGITRRHELGPADVQAIRDLPGENYLVDLELAELDVTFHYKFAKYWGAYLIMSGVHYGGGFLDSTIESFHKTFGFSTFGRKAASRNDVNVIFDLKSSQVAEFEAPTSGGLLDPTIGVRYSGFEPFKGWNMVLEAAAKVPVGGHRAFLSTGKTDFGVQGTLQHFAEHHAYYVSLAGVYYDGSNSITPTDPQVIPTLLLGYEHRFTPDTHLIFQGYVSPSIYSSEDTDLDELRATKYQLSLGMYHRMGSSVLSFGITENFQNIDNTPDIGVQFGWAYSPALKR
jgi:hypothetical protein